MVKKCYLEGIFDILEKGQKKTAIWKRNLKSGEGIDIKIRNMKDLRGFGVLPDKI